MNTLLSLIFVYLIAFLSIGQVEEIKELRTLNSKTVRLSNGLKQTTISSGAMHYEENHQFLPINTRLIKENDRFLNQTNTFKTSFPTTYSPNDYIEVALGNDLIRITNQKEWVCFTDIIENAHLQSFQLSASEGQIESSTINYASSDYTDQFIIENDALKNNVILNQAIPFLASTNEKYLGFSEEITLPEGWKILPTEAKSEGELIDGSLFILNSKNEIQLEIPAPLIYEKNDPNSDGSSTVFGNYIIDHSGNVWNLYTLFDATWLKDPNRSFPIVIDPTFNGVGAAGGWMSPVTVVNNPAYVFVGFCCGNQQHRAWINFNTSSISDASCITNVELQFPITHVGGATAELTHAYDMTYLPGPYAAVDPLVMADFISGYYTSFTLGGVGTYGYYDLSAAADAILQSQLGVNWYQVGLVFDNENSTNWKRISATASNIRITHLDPPCTVLPIELSDFSVGCDDNKALLNWTTISEFNNDYFTIWESEDGYSFHDVATIDAVGNSQNEQHYTWDSPIKRNSECFYRLSQTDFNGSVEFFDIKRYQGCTDEIQLHQLSNGEILIQGEDILNIQILDASGRMIVSETSNPNSKEAISIPKFTEVSGIYFVSIEKEWGEVLTRKIFITEK